jgi:predicted enzyme related to lactoylglutathione lyase
MKILEFAFVAYPVTDLARARAFYEGVLGLTRTPSPKDAEAKWFEYEVGPHTLGIGSSPMWKPSSDGPSLALEVEDLDESIAQLKAHGVKFHMEPFESPVCRAAVILDPDGNKICIHKRKA